MPAAVVLVQADDEAAQRGITERDATSVPPVQRNELVLAWRKLSGGGVIFVKISIRIGRSRKRADEPVQGVAEGRLAGFVAPKAGKHSVLGHAFNSERQRARAIVEQKECGRRPERADQRARFDRADSRHHHVGVDDRDRDDGVAENAGALAPRRCEGAGRPAGGKGIPQLAQQARNDSLEDIRLREHIAPCTPPAPDF